MSEIFIIETWENHHWKGEIIRKMVKLLILVINSCIILILPHFYYIFIKILSNDTSTLMEQIKISERDTLLVREDKNTNNKNKLDENTFGIHIMCIISTINPFKNEENTFENTVQMCKNIITLDIIVHLISIYINWYTNSWNQKLMNLSVIITYINGTFYF
eukprot:384900_1